MVEMLETRKLDFIVDTLPIDSKKKVTKITVAKLKNCFAYNKNSMKNVTIETEKDLQKYPLVLPSVTSSIRFKLDEYMESKNINLSPTVESWTNEMMVELVKKGIGIGYFIKNLIISQNDSDNFEIIEFDDNLPDVDICCVYIDDFLTAASSKFIELLTNKSDVD